MIFGAWTVLSSLVCAYKTGCLWQGETLIESEREKKEKEREVQSTGPGQGSVGCSDEVGGPLQEVVPQHEGRGYTPPNEG